MPVGVVGQLLAEDEDRVERRAQLVGHVGEELGLVLGGEGQLGGLFLQRAAGLLDLAVLPLDLGVLLGQQLGLGGQLLVGLLKLALARLELDGQLLRLLEQALGAHRRFDRVEHDADAERELIEEVRLVEVKGWSEASSMTALICPSKSRGRTTILEGGASPRLELMRV